MQEPLRSDSKAGEQARLPAHDVGAAGESLAPAFPSDPEELSVIAREEREETALPRLVFKELREIQLSSAQHSIVSATNFWCRENFQHSQTSTQLVSAIADSDRRFHSVQHDLHEIPVAISPSGKRWLCEAPKEPTLLGGWARKSTIRSSEGLKLVITCSADCELAFDADLLLAAEWDDQRIRILDCQQAAARWNPFAEAKPREVGSYSFNNSCFPLSGVVDVVPVTLSKEDRLLWIVANDSRLSCFYLGASASGQLTGEVTPVAFCDSSGARIELKLPLSSQVKYVQYSADERRISLDIVSSSADRVRQTHQLVQLTLDLAASTATLLSHREITPQILLAHTNLGLVLEGSKLTLLRNDVNHSEALASCDLEPDEAFQSGFVRGERLHIVTTRRNRPGAIFVKGCELQSALHQ